MSSGYDPVPDIERLGYTEREAAFLYLVAIHSGYCLRRQFLYFIERDDGAIVQRFLQKGVEREHLRPIEYATGRHVYHLKAKLLYWLIAQPDSRNRREKSDWEIKLRLMQLDYVLDHPAQKFLESEAAKVESFCNKLRLPEIILPKRGEQTSSNSRYFPDRMPVAITERNSNSPFGELCFCRRRSALALVVREMARTTPQSSALVATREGVYVADTPRNFDGAEYEFDRRFSESRVTIRGHLLEYDYPLWSMKYNIVNFEQNSNALRMKLGQASNRFRTSSDGVRACSSLHRANDWKRLASACASHHCCGSTSAPALIIACNQR